MAELSPEEILRRPYSRVLVPDPEQGGFTAYILEFSGCIAEGETVTEAYENLDRTALSWLAVCQEQRLSVPEPLAERLKIIRRFAHLQRQ